MPIGRPKNPDKPLECGICHKMEPEVKIRTLNGGPRAHKMCSVCRNAVRRSERKMRDEVSNHTYDILWKVNWDSLLKLPYDNYKLTYSLKDEPSSYPGGALCLKEDFVWIYTYEGTYQWPAPYDRLRIAKHLAYLHLYVSSEKFPELSEEERAELEKSKDLKALQVFGVY